MADKILVVDDDDAMRELLSYHLERENFQVVLASSGMPGYKIAQQTPQPDLILLDVDLPGIDGLSLAQTLHDNPATNDIPVIFLTVRAEQKDKLAAFQAGGADYLTKPFNPDELIARIKATLHRVKIERQKAQADLETYKRQLAGNVGHELLTPMGKVLNGLEILTRLSAEKGLTAFDDVIQIIHNGANELYWLLEDLLVVNQISDNNINVFRKESNFSQNVTTIVQQSKVKYNRNHLTFTVSMPDDLTVNVQRRHLTHMLHHIIDNACKFSPPHSTIKIAVQRVGQAGILMDVFDNGSGIPNDLLETVFDKFYQVDMSISRVKDGLGVGLHIARTLARNYGGDVTLRSKLNFGTHCSLRLPDVMADGFLL